jgi:hypothetical protein
LGSKRCDWDKWTQRFWTLGHVCKHNVVSQSINEWERKRVSESEWERELLIRAERETLRICFQYELPFYLQKELTNEEQETLLWRRQQSEDHEEVFLCEWDRELPMSLRFFVTH